MLPLFVWCLVGIVFHFILSAVQSMVNNVTFQFKKEGLIAGTYVILAAIGAYYAAQANMAGWVMKLLFLAIGFLLPFVTSKLITIKP